MKLINLLYYSNNDRLLRVITKVDCENNHKNIDNNNKRKTATQ